MKNRFSLSIAQLTDIANDLTKKIITGLEKDGTEIKCLPTYIHPKKDAIKGDATVIDLGGTNFRVATVTVGQKTTIPGSAERDITEMKKDGFTEEDLLSAQAKTIEQIEIPKDTPIGYCFSYPAKCLINGDAELIKWTKGVHISEMEGKPIGKPLLDYLNKNTGNRFKSIKVLNDTITSLFAGLLNHGYDAYIGIIVGTGTNMASFFPSEYIPKLRDTKDWHGETPVNLESGNFYPPHLTAMDDAVDAKSDNKGFQRFEKAVSGMYLGRIFREALPGEKLDENLSAVDLSRMINNPFQYKEEHVETAYLIYERSAKLVAASLSGLVQNLHAADPKIRRVQVLAEGSLFWSKVSTGKASYADVVNASIKEILSALDLPDIEVTIAQMENANLIGAAMAVLS